jgi:UPF0716 protein FxsA
MRQRLGWLGIGLLVLAVLEIALLVFVTKWLGLAVTVLLVVLTTVLGGWRLRREGTRAWRALRQAAAAGRPVGAEVSDGLVGLLSAVLLVVPGFLTDAAGLLLLVPPVRGGARRGVRRLTERQVSSAVAGDLFGPRQVKVHVRPEADPSGEAPIEGEIVDS